MGISLKLIKDNTACLSGSMTFDSLCKIAQVGYGMIDQHTYLVIDCLNIQNSNSSFIALVVGWKKHANAKHHKLDLVNVPENLCDIANLYGLDHLFNTNTTQ